MSKITSKMRFLDESRLSFKIEDGMLQVMDQMENVIGTRPLPIPIDTDNMDVEEIYQKAEECGYSIDDMISEIVQDSVIEKREYDAWLSPDLFIFYSPTKGEWVSEPYEGIFAIMKDMYEEDMKEIEMGADSVETENLDCPIEENEDSLITNKDPNFDYGDEDEDTEDDVDYVSQILGYTPSEETDETEDTVSAEEETTEEMEEEIPPVEEIEVPVEPKVEEVVETKVVEEVKLEKKPEPQVQPTKQPEVKNENKPQHNNNNNNNNQQKKQKNTPPEPQVQPTKQPEVKNENKQNSQNNNKGQNNQNQNAQKNEQKQDKVVSKNEKEKVNMSQNQQNSTKSFAWNDKAKTLRSAVDELNKYKNEVKSNEIAELAKYVVSVIEEKHMDPNNADEKEILYTLALNDKTIIKGLTPVRAGIYKAMLMKELRSLGF